MFDSIVNAIMLLFGAGTYDNAIDINLVNDFVLGDTQNPKTFYLYVGVSGIVKGVDKGGSSFSRNFTAGYHCFKCRKVLSTANGTTATDLAACF